MGVIMVMPMIIHMCIHRIEFCVIKIVVSVKSEINRQIECE